jgi:hypothetical protein
MINLVLIPKDLDAKSLLNHLRARLAALDPDAVVRVQLRGPGSDKARKFLSAALLRDLALLSMNINLAQSRAHFGRERKLGRR